jgi:hypothetical protein
VEHFFGPKMQLRVVGGICGVILLVIGGGFLLVQLSVVGGRLPLRDEVSGMLAVPLTALGGLLLIGTRLAPLNWVFICQGGVIRKRGAVWESLPWAEVERFEDATLGRQGVIFRQCRLVLKNGREWGFLADHVTAYRQLAEVLRQKVAERNVPTDPPRPGPSPSAMISDR